jgi:anhydro-N-acetylmuramic acid kinase
MKILGLMSGSSLDGLDIAYAAMAWNAAQTEVVWQLQVAETLPFSAVWQSRLRDLPTADALAFARTHTYFGHYMAELVLVFLEKNKIAAKDIDLISSHGHTIFHQPDRRFTTQIGCGAALAALTQCPVVCDFRTQDIALNGEGTPLAPIADRYLFPNYDFHLNIGGIANISSNINGHFVAFDTGAANQILNRLANTIGLEYDKNGENARKGSLQPVLLDALAALPYHAQPFPKSLSNQWVQGVVGELVAAFPADTNDKLHTMTQHIADEIARSAAMCAPYLLENKKENTKNDINKTMLITGGGTLNIFLIEKIQAALLPLGIKIIVPERDIINFKEALLMCVLGFLRVNKRTNTMASVTGALRDTIGGAVYLG